MANRYWIGGTGSWNDIVHWSSTSGGTPGASEPISSDDVFFDSNSFHSLGQIVTVTPNAVCKDMIWNGSTNSPVLQVDNNFNVYGSIKFISGVTGSGLYPIIMNGASQVYNSSGAPIYHLKLAATGITLVGNNTFTKLTINAGLSVTITAGSTQTMVILETPIHTGFVTLRSTSLGNAYTLSAGQTYIGYIDVKDSTATGGGSFNNIGGQDNGNNTGWTFIPNRNANFDISYFDIDFFDTVITVTTSTSTSTTTTSTSTSTSTTTTLTSTSTTTTSTSTSTSSSTSTTTLDPLIPKFGQFNPLFGV